MKISELTSAVNELWAFLWPRVMLVVILIAVALYIAPHASAMIGGALLDWSTRTAISARPHLAAFGLNSLIPIVGFFTILFLLYATHAIVFFVGNVLPPGVAYRPDFLLARDLENEEVAALWKDYSPDIGLYQIAQLVRTGAALSGGKEYWHGRSLVIGAGLNAAKFVVSWIIAMFVVEIWISGITTVALMHAFQLFIVWTIAAFGLFSLFLYAIHQQVVAAEVELRQYLHVSAKGTERRLSKDEAELLKSQQTSSWWNFDVPAWRYARWFYDNVLRGSR